MSAPAGDGRAQAANPVLVEVVRGDRVESFHRGAVAVCDAAGRVAAAWGDVARPVFPRSAVKPLQALPLVETGAADAFRLSPREIALACASHSGEPEHVALVEQWLAVLGLGESALACGAHPPLEPEAVRALIRDGHPPGRVHNNCSGKHCGFLSAARHLGEPVEGYHLADHPAQRRVAQALSEMTGHDLEGTGWAVDGCGIPTFAIPLRALATGMARLGNPAGLPPTRRAAAERIAAAMAAHPHLVAGSGRLCTELLLAAPRVLPKAGAEGVYAAALPDLGLGLALKIDDGAKRAAEVALLAALEHVGALPPEALARLAQWRRPPLSNVAGRVVGIVRPADHW